MAIVGLILFIVLSLLGFIYMCTARQRKSNDEIDSKVEELKSTNSTSDEIHLESITLQKPLPGIILSRG